MSPRQWPPRQTRVKKQEDADKVKREGERDEAVLAAMNAISNQLESNQKNQGAADARRETRERGTIFGLVVTVAIASVAAYFSWCQANAARKSFDSFQESRMAFVTATGLGLQVVKVKTKDDTETVDFIFTNSGDTPTVGLQWFSYIRGSQAYDSDHALNGAKITPIHSLISPKSNIRDWHTHFLIKEIRDAAKHEQPALAGWIAYKDVSGKKHRTYFCYRLQTRDEGPITYLTCDDLPPCADKECEENPKYDEQLRTAFTSASTSGPIPELFLP